MRLSGDWLAHPGTQGLCAALEAAGHQAWLVGGCVRDALLGREVGDIDIATDAHPETVSALAETAGFRVVPTGIDHGTVTVIAEGRPHEVTTFRRDVETDGRRARVAFSDRVEEDAARRDFTMNALYADRRGAVADPMGGLPDLRAGRVRFVGRAEDRVREDYLRILRFFRFFARYGRPDEGLDPEGLTACAAHAEGLDRLSRERVGAEMKKLLAAPDPAPALAAMAQAGVLGRILPGADPRALGPLVHLEAGLDPDPLRRLAALGGEGAEQALRLSRAEARDLAALHDALGCTDSPAALGWRLGRRRGTDAVLLRAALFGAPPAPDALAEVARGAESRFPVTAADLAPLEGEALGQRLAALRDRWLAADLHPDREALLRADGLSG